PVLPPAFDAPGPGIGKFVSTGGPPKAVPSVLMKTSRMSDTVAPAGSRSETRTHPAVSVPRGPVAWRSGGDSGDPGSGPSVELSSDRCDALVNGRAAPVAEAMSADSSEAAVPA